MTLNNSGADYCMVSLPPVICLYRYPLRVSWSTDSIFTTIKKSATVGIGIASAVFALYAYELR